MTHSVLIPVFIHDMKLKIDFAVVTDGRMMTLGVDGLKFLDVPNYLAPGFNYSKFLKCHNVEAILARPWKLTEERRVLYAHALGAVSTKARETEAGTVSLRQ